jgi:hypothetical protein
MALTNIGIKKILLTFLAILCATANAQEDRLSPVQMVVNGNMATNITSAPLYVLFKDNVGIHYLWTGTPTGTIGVSVSNLYSNGSCPTAASAYTALTLTGISEPSGSAGTFWLDLNQTGATCIEITYVSTSGAGTLNVYVSAKEI